MLIGVAAALTARALTAPPTTRSSTPLWCSRLPMIRLHRGILTATQCRGIRKRLRRCSVLVNTYVEGSGPGEREPCSITRVPGSSPPAVAKPIQVAGKSGSDLPAGTGIARVFPGETAEAPRSIST